MMAPSAQLVLGNGGDEAECLDDAGVVQCHVALLEALQHLRGSA